MGCVQGLPKLSLRVLIFLLLISPLFAAVRAQGTTIVTVDTTGVLADGDTKSVGALLANRGSDGKISFTEALAAVNASGPGYTINFNLPHGATIFFNGTLFLTAPDTIIDGDVGGDGTPDVIFESPDNIIWLRILSDNNIIRRLVFKQLDLFGPGAHHNQIFDSYIGTDVDGIGHHSRIGNGVVIKNGANHNIVENNIIAGNTVFPGPSTQFGRVGIAIQDNAHDNRVVGNRIGLNVKGDPLPNDIGIKLLTGASQNVIGDNRSSDACVGSCNVISGNNWSGLIIEGAGTVNNVVKGNYIGLSPSGAESVPNGFNGVAIYNKATQNLVGGVRSGTACSGPCNVISGNSLRGVVILDIGTANNKVLGNFIGVDPSGATGLPNAWSGVAITDGATQNSIGDTRATAVCDGPCNVVSGNSLAGVALLDSGTENNVVQGNYIGLAVNGTQALPNGFMGVTAQRGAAHNRIGGERPGTVCSGPCNVISGNHQQGVFLLGTDLSNIQTTGITGQGDNLGPSSTEQTAGPEDYLDHTAQAAAAGNALSSLSLAEGCSGPCNGGSRVLQADSQLLTSQTSNNRVEGNFIGLNRDGTEAVPNELEGILIAGGASQNVIGGNREAGPCSGPCNVIRSNSGSGVAIVGETTRGNTIRANELRGNGGLGIDLGGDGLVTPNDQGDNDNGPNGLMNFPMGVTAVYNSDTDTTTISGSLDTQNPASATIDIYADDDVDPSGQGEGRLYLGSVIANNDGSFELTMPGQLIYRFLSATATDENGSTSEFAPRPPLLFIPGIAGSLLVDGPGGDMLWLPFGLGDSGLDNPVSRLNRLSLYPEDNPSQSIFAPDVVNQIVPWLMPIYRPLLDFLTSRGGYSSYELKFDFVQQPPAIKCDYEGQKMNNPNLFVFPYDWRKSNVENAERLKNYMACIRQFYPESKVDVLTHSMGSLLARRYILDNANDHNVNKLITIGAPWLGAAKMIYVLETGDFLDIAPNLPLIGTAFKRIAGSSLGAHQLLPSQAYFELLGGSPLVEEGWNLDGQGEDTEEYTYGHYIDIINSRHGRSGFLPGLAGHRFHVIDHQGRQDDWSADSTGINYYHLYGIQSGENAISRVAATVKTVCNGPAAGTSLGCIPKNVFEIKRYFTLGDGTVPWFSAQRIGYNAANACLIMFYGPYSHGDDLVEHNGLNGNPSVHDTVFSLLTLGSAPSLPSQPLSSCTPATGVQSAAGTVPPVQPYYYLTVSGGSAVVVSDTQGNSTASIGDTFRGKVPGVATYTLGDHVELTVLPTTGSYNITFQTIGQPIAVELTRGTSDTATEAIRYQDLALPGAVTALLKITEQGVDLLRYDSDGNGTFDTSVTPTVTVSGPQANDLEAPLISVTAVNQQTTTQVSLSAQDSGSGLKALYFSLDGTNFQPYTGNLQIDPMKTPILYAIADDHVANRSTLVYPLSLTQAPQDFKIYLPTVRKNSN